MANLKKQDARISEARDYLAYARECLQLAEKATESDIQNSLIELSHIWMEAALQKERLLHGTAPEPE